MMEGQRKAVLAGGNTTKGSEIEAFLGLTEVTFTASRPVRAAAAGRK